jgi:predicted ATP-dependent serine protease
MRSEFQEEMDKLLSAVSRAEDLKVEEVIDDVFAIRAFSTGEIADVEQTPRITFGLSGIDNRGNKTKGLMVGTVVSINADPGSGKTTAAMNFLSHVTKNREALSLYINLEMSESVVKDYVKRLDAQFNFIESYIPTEDCPRSFEKKAIFARLHNTYLACVLDSVPKLGHVQCATSTIAKLIGVARKYQAVLILLNHLGNKSRRVAGPQQALNQVDEDYRIYRRPGQPIMMFVHKSRNSCNQGTSFELPEHF